MSSEKADAIVIRQVDFSETSRVVTLFTREFGKIGCLAKGARRLKGPFESGLDLLSCCRIVFLKKSGGGLDLLTESHLVRRFRPKAGSLSHLYAGYYVAELLAALTEEHDPHAALFDAAETTLVRLETVENVFLPVSWFELALLQEIGQLPDFETCTICHSEMGTDVPARFWVSQSGLICSRCGHSEYQATEIQPGSLEILRRLLVQESEPVMNSDVPPVLRREVRKILTSAMSYVLGHRPKTLPMISM
jgi:DNA repair protein RecO (recombination protein O)